MVTHIGMKLSTHTCYVTPMTHKWFPWQQPTANSLRQFSLKSLLHFSNLPTMVHMEMKLCPHMYLIVSMTTVNKKCPQAFFPITTSSLLKLANHAMHGGETWCTYIQCKKATLRMHMHFSVSMTTIDQKWPQALFSITTSSPFNTCILHTGSSINT